MTSQEGNAGKSLDESSWMEKLEEEGLGKGIDIANPDQLLPQQLTPTPNNLRIRKADDNRFDSTDVEESISDFSKGGQSQRLKGGRIVKIRNKTVSFKHLSHANSSIRLVKKLTKEAEKDGLNYSGLNPPNDAKREDICKKVLEEEKSTHFISSVELGAKYSETIAEEQDFDDVDSGIVANINVVAGGIGGAGAGADVGKRALRGERQICRERVYNGIVLDDPQQMSTEQEDRIAFSVKPIWKLIEDKTWRKSVKKAVLEYLPEYLPVPVGPETPVLIKTASTPPKYLKVTNDESKGEAVKKVEATATKSEADGFFLEYQDKNESDFDEKLKGKYPFSLVFRDGEERLYFAPDENNTIVLSNHIHEGNGMFTLAAPNHFQDRSASDWQDPNNSFFVRHNNKKVKRKRLFLSTTNCPDPTPLKMTPKKEIHRQDSQFCLETPIGTY